LRFEIAGRLKHLDVREGDRVEKGDVLATLDSETWEFKLAEAQARLDLARSERDRLVNGASPESREVAKSDVRAAEVLVREAESHYTRAKQVSQRNAMSSQELDEYRYKHEKAVAQLQTIRARWEEIEAPVRPDDLAVAQAKVALAEALVRQERNALEKTRLRAPERGVVLHLATEPGELVGPADEAPLITLANRDGTRIRAFVEELDALDIAVGQKAFVTADGKPGTAYEGTVKSCSPQVRPKSNRHHKPGEFIDVRVREVVIELFTGDDLVMGLPVDVFIEGVPAR
jgi:multidrug resistance efflux pump